MLTYAVANAFRRRGISLLAIGNLDTRTGLEVIRLIQEINERDGKTIILVTHDLRIARRCHRSIYLRDGVICSEEESGLAGIN